MPIKLEIFDYLKYGLPVMLLELIAALAGIFYLKRVSASSITKYLVYYIWFTFFIEIVGTYNTIAYFENGKFFSLINNTPFMYNKWLYNVYNVFSFSFFMYYFAYYLKNQRVKKMVRFGIGGYLISSVISFFSVDGFFKMDSLYLILMGTFLVFIVTVLFYFELLRSDRILNLKRFLPTYIAVGTMVFFLCTTPLSIFSENFFLRTGDKMFVNLQMNIVLYSNIFMYSCFIIGFLICSLNKKSY